MSGTSKYHYFNDKLFAIIPTRAKRILDIGCDTGLLGKALKDQDASRYVAGIEIQASAAEEAKEVLDAVHVLNIESDDLSVVDGQFDAIILGDVVEHLLDPVPALEKVRQLLNEDGELITSIPNIQHHSIFRRLLKGDFQYQDSGLLDSTHVRFYCLANIDKLLLDAGFIPRLNNRNLQDDAVMNEQLSGVLAALGLGQQQLENIETFQYQTVSRKAEELPDEPVTPMTFIVHSRYSGILKDNFYASPIFNGQHPHQILLYRRGSTLPEAWSQGIAAAKHSHIAFVNEDVYLPKDWDLRASRDIRHMTSLSADNWIAGVHHQHHHGSLLAPGEKEFCQIGEPKAGALLGDGVLIMPTSNTSTISAELGAFLHGTDQALMARERGDTVYALNNPCLQNGTYLHRTPPGYRQSMQALKAKWPQLAKK